MNVSVQEEAITAAGTKSINERLEIEGLDSSRHTRAAVSGDGKPRCCAPHT